VGVGVTRNNAKDVGDMKVSKVNKLVLLLDSELNILDEQRSSVYRLATREMHF
jgi:hypothetical protein